MLSAHFNFAASHITRNVASASRAHAKAMEQVSSGYKINVGADGPADLLISEKLRSQIDGIERAMRNTSESGNILGIMEGALGQVQNIISRMSGLAIEAANSGITSPDRIAANQAEIDAGLQAINRIFETTSYGGRKLLGNLQTSGAIGDDYRGTVEAGKLLKKNDGKLPEEAYAREGKPGKLFMLAENQEHEEQVSKDGMLVNGDKTFVLPPEEEGGEPVELTFKEGSTWGEVFAGLKEHGMGSMTDFAEKLADLPRGDPIPMYSADSAPRWTIGFPTGRTGADINRVELDADQLAALNEMSPDEAQAALADYMNNFTREIELDLDGWNKLSDADQALLMTGDRFANLGMDDLGGILDASGEELTLSDLYSGHRASLQSNPAAAIDILNQARKSVTAERAQLGVTQRMAQHGMDADAATKEALMRMESFIRDTRIDEAATEMARTEILQQTGMTLLKKAMEQHRRNITGLLDMTA